MATKPLMQAAAEQNDSENTGPAYTPKDAREHVPEDLHDDVDKVVAAGVRMIYSDALADERQAAVTSTEPAAKVMADNVTGLMLMLDQKSRGGIPQAVIFPAAIMLLNEVAELMTQAGKKISEDDYNSATQILYVQLGKKLGATDDQLMQGAEQALKGQGGEQPADPNAAPPEGEMPPDAEPVAPPPDEEEEPIA